MLNLVHKDFKAPITAILKEVGKHRYMMNEQIGDYKKWECRTEKYNI